MENSDENQDKLEKIDYQLNRLKDYTFAEISAETATEIIKLLGGDLTVEPGLSKQTTVTNYMILLLAREVIELKSQLALYQKQ